MKNKIVFFIDVDNTLLDNDLIKNEIKKSLEHVLGKAEAGHFWHHHDQFREDKKLVDFPNIIREYCEEKHKDTCEMKLGKIFNSIEFHHALYPQALAVIKHLRKLGRVVLFTEGDNVYQKRKIEQSGLGAAADEVQLYAHRLDHLANVLKGYQGYKVVFIDDRAETLRQMKDSYPAISTIEVCQGHYATTDHKPHESLDLSIQSINELLHINMQHLKK